MAFPDLGTMAWPVGACIAEGGGAARPLPGWTSRAWRPDSAIYDKKVMALLARPEEWQADDVVTLVEILASPDVAVPQEEHLALAFWGIVAMRAVIARHPLPLAAAERLLVEIHDALRRYPDACYWLTQAAALSDTLADVHYLRLLKAQTAVEGLHLGHAFRQMCDNRADEDAPAGEAQSDTPPAMFVNPRDVAAALKWASVNRAEREIAHPYARAIAYLFREAPYYDDAFERADVRDDLAVVLGELAHGMAGSLHNGERRVLDTAPAIRGVPVSTWRQLQSRYQARVRRAMSSVAGTTRDANPQDGAPRVSSLWGGETVAAGVPGGVPPVIGASERHRSLLSMLSAGAWERWSHALSDDQRHRLYTGRERQWRRKEIWEHLTAPLDQQTDGATGSSPAPAQVTEVAARLLSDVPALSSRSVGRQWQKMIQAQAAWLLNGCESTPPDGASLAQSLIGLYGIAPSHRSTKRGMPSYFRAAMQRACGAKRAMADQASDSYRTLSCWCAFAQVTPDLWHHVSERLTPLFATFVGSADIAPALFFETGLAAGLDYYRTPLAVRLGGLSEAHWTDVLRETASAYADDAERLIERVSAGEVCADVEDGDRYDACQLLTRTVAQTVIAHAILDLFYMPQRWARQAGGLTPPPAATNALAHLLGTDAWHRLVDVLPRAYRMQVAKLLSERMSYVGDVADGLAGQTYPALHSLLARRRFLDEILHLQLKLLPA